MRLVLAVTALALASCGQSEEQSSTINDAAIDAAAAKARSEFAFEAAATEQTKLYEYCVELVEDYMRVKFQAMVNRCQARIPFPMDNPSVENQELYSKSLGACQQNEYKAVDVCRANHPDLDSRFKDWIKVHDANLEVERQREIAAHRAEQRVEDRAAIGLASSGTCTYQGAKPSVRFRDFKSAVLSAKAEASRGANITKFSNAEFEAAKAKKLALFDAILPMFEPRFAEFENLRASDPKCEDIRQTVSRAEAELEKTRRFPLENYLTRDRLAPS